jgi:hypothetical protein
MSQFVFQWPAALALLLLTVPLVWLLARARRKRLQIIQAMGGGHPTHRKLRDVLRVLAVALCMLAFARPGYSPRTESTSRTGRDVVFAIDVSQSMLAEDTPPSRLEVAKQGVRDALNTFTNERVGLVVYAGSSSILCPLTYDYDFVRYMLDQANPRTVDFGGTTLQSAVEKVVDQVFMEGREEVQDLIVLTDGGDHDSVTAKAIDLLNTKGVDTLLIGLGDPRQGAPIKLKDEDGNIQLLEYQGSAVYTKLEDVALRAFAAESSRVTYLPIGTQPFNLGQAYIDYAKDKPVDAADSENGVTIYQEAAVFFLVPALLLLLLSERWGTRRPQMAQLAVIGATLILLPRSQAADGFETNFNHAVDILEAGNFEEASTLLSELHRTASASVANAEQIAAIHFNRGLALIGQSTAQETPQIALGYAQDAQLAFLEAKRSSPGLERAGIRLQLTAQTVSELRIQIEAMEQENDEINEQLQRLVERLQELLKSQTELRESVAKAELETTAPQQILRFIESQTEQRLESQALQIIMQEIDASMQAQPADSPLNDSLMTEPIRLIQQAQTSQEAAAGYLKQVDQWSLSRELQVDAEHAIEQILELLTSDSEQDSSESEEWEEMEEDYESMEESGEGMSSSDPMEGDFAAGSEMQALPVPNYSAEDILMEEQGNQQFRQQKRASANAANVEKDF